MGACGSASLAAPSAPVDTPAAPGARRLQRIDPAHQRAGQGREGEGGEGHSRPGEQGAWASEIASCTSTSPRLTNDLRKSVQNASVSASSSASQIRLTSLFDVDVNQFARPRPFIALRGLEPEPAEPAHPDPGQDPRHRRDRHVEQFGDLWTCEAQPAQRGDRLGPPLIGAIGDPLTRRAAIKQPGL
jgi:hypothetical protein